MDKLKGLARSVSKTMGKRPRTSTTPSSSHHSGSQHSHHSGSHHSHHSNQPQEPEDESEDEVTGPEEPLNEQPSQPTFGITFYYQKHVNKFLTVRQRKIFNTRFYHKDDMNSLGLHNGILTLFSNIGWEGFLKWDEWGYAEPTLEFASTCYNSRKYLFFRAGNRQQRIATDDICALAGAPTTDTVTLRTSPQPSAPFAEFWLAITGLRDYNPKHLKTSFILHPVLRVTARIITCSFACREEAGTINTNELFILWCMVYKPDLTPHFGDYLRVFLVRMSESKVPIYFSGIVTKLLRSSSVQYTRTTVMEKLASERYLRKSNLIAGKLLREDTNANTATWLVGPNKIPHLHLKKRSFQSTFRLNKRTADTNWCLASNIGTPGASGSGSGTRDTGPVMDPPEPARHSEASFFAPLQDNYTRLHSDYQGLHGNYTSLHNDYQALYGSFSSMSTDISGLRTDYSLLRDDYSSLRHDVSSLRSSFEAEQLENQAARTEMRSFISGRQSVDSELNRMVSSLFDWHISEHSSQPPPQ